MFLGGTGKHLRIMVEAPRDKNIVRSTVLERNITDPGEREKLPKYYAQEEHPEKYVRKTGAGKNAEAVVRAKGSEAADSAPNSKKLEMTRKPRIIITRGNAGSR